MGLTPNSSSSPFCTPSQMMSFYDVNLMGQLCSDSGTPITVAALPSNTNFLNAIQGAAGDLELACVTGGRYLPSDLTNLANSGSNGSFILAKLNASLAFQTLRERRGYYDHSEWPDLERAQETLEKLRLGERCLPFVESEAAGDGTQQPMGWNSQRKIPLATQVARRFFGRRAEQYRPRSYGGWW
jgi:hypothetical protein